MHDNNDDRPGPMRALLVHGAGGGAWEWGIWQQVFTAHGIASEAIDLQPVGAGITATHLHDYVQQVRNARAHIDGRCALVGASLGGLLAALCADAADALVLVNPLPPAPWAAQLPGRTWPDVVRWGRDARLQSTLASMPDADAASVMHAFRHWRDESGAVLREAHAGVVVERPRCPVLCVVSASDDDVPPAITEALAHEWQASLQRTACASHVGPLLGRDAASVALDVTRWLSGR